MMDELENSMNPDAMHALYAKTLHALREARKATLRRHDVANEEQLLAKIRRRDIAEHPGYEQYLGARIIEQTRMQLRGDLLAQIGGAEPAAGTESLHLTFPALLETAYGSRLTEPVRIAQDALLLSFDTGLMMEARFFSADEYSLRWWWGEAERCIDTAPVHPGMGPTSAHLHCGDGSIVAWRPGSAAPEDCWKRFSMLIDTLLTDPLLERADPSEQSGAALAETGN